MWGRTLEKKQEEMKNMMEKIKVEKGKIIKKTKSRKRRRKNVG
jgi:hypothetical protein